MEIQHIQGLYEKSSRLQALLKSLGNKSNRYVFLEGLFASAVPLFFASLAKKTRYTFLFILQNADDAGYFYHDLTQIMGQEQVLFFPSSYRRAIKFGQRDAANEILRTEVLARLSNQPSPNTQHPTANSQHPTPFFIVSYPEALAEMVVSKKNLDERIVKLSAGQEADIVAIENTLRGFGFQEVDYVYEPGQFAVRGSILDVYSFSCELPFRIDFFGDEIDSIRTFEVQDQLSKDRRASIEIVPELAGMETEKIPFLNFLPTDSILVMKDFAYIHDTIEQIYNDGFSSQALTERLNGATEMEQQQIMRDMRRESQLSTATQFTEGAASFRRIEYGPHAEGNPQVTLRFSISAQPLFHKNIELLKQTIDDYLLQGYQLYILADSPKQHQRLHEILLHEEEGKEVFIPIDHTLHEGFVDHDLHACFFTDHQIFDRFHKYNLKSDGARAGKMALTMKELQELEVGDYLVHVDYGIGKFAGLVRIPIASNTQQPTPSTQAYQEVIRIVYQHNDKVDVSIHSLYKISKYRRSDTGEPPRP